MAHSPIFLKKLLLMSVGVLFMTAIVTTAKADDRVVREHEFELDGITEIEIINGVGSVEIIPIDGDKLKINVEIESNSNGFFNRSVDVDDLDIVSRERGESLILEFEEKHVSAHWIVETPRVERTRVNQGVGEVRVDIENTELDIKLGVGDVVVNGKENTTGRVHARVGVGDARVRGGDILDSDRAFISQTIRAEGKGSNDVDVDVGVGDVNIRLD